MGMTRRNTEIVTAIEAGEPRRVVARKHQISVGRVSQILEEHKRKLIDPNRLFSMRAVNVLRTLEGALNLGIAIDDRIQLDRLREALEDEHVVSRLRRTKNCGRITLREIMRVAGLQSKVPS